MSCLIAGVIFMLSVTGKIPEKPIKEIVDYLHDFPMVKEVSYYHELGAYRVECVLDIGGNEPRQMTDLRNHCIAAEQRFYKVSL